MGWGVEGRQGEVCPPVDGVSFGINVGWTRFGGECRGGDSWPGGCLGFGGGDSVSRQNCSGELSKLSAKDVSALLPWKLASPFSEYWALKICLLLYNYF